MTLRVKICELHQITPTPAKLDCAFSADFSAYIACPAHVIRTSQANTNPTRPSPAPTYAEPRARFKRTVGPLREPTQWASLCVDGRGSTAARTNLRTADGGGGIGLSASSSPGQGATHCCMALLSSTPMRSSKGKASAVMLTGAQRVPCQQTLASTCLMRFVQRPVPTRPASVC